MMEHCRREDLRIDADRKIAVIVLISGVVPDAFELANDDLGLSDDETISSEGSAELVTRNFGAPEPRYLGDCR